MDKIFKNAICVLPGLTAQADIGIKEGKIVAIGALGDNAAEVIDCTGLHILPGLMDTQVHFREPGATHKEDLEHGMKGAVAGGITSIFEMPNTMPLTTTPEALADKINRARKGAWTDFAFYFGGTAENAQYLPEWENLKGVCGIKIFMGSRTGDLLVASDEDVEAVLSTGKRIVAVHAEDEMIMRENKIKILGDSHDVKLHPVWRSEEGCLSATTRLVRIARKCGRRIHVLHITTAQEM